jgi:acetyl-CoA carboxylase carboxyltransferase component
VAAWGTEYPVGASVVTGVGVVEGVECVVVANDPTVQGGAVNPYTERKIRRAAEIAVRNRLPLVTLVESTGSGSGTPGRVAGELASCGSRGLPSVCVVFGPASTDAAYLPALSAYTIMVGSQARVQLAPPAGPPSAAAGEFELADFVADDERDGIRLARQCVRRLNWRKQGPPPRTDAPALPRHEPEDLLTIGGTAGLEPREVLARVLDGSVFDEFKPGTGAAVVAGWGEIHGYPVAPLAVGGMVGAAEARKAAQFIRLANGSATPLLVLRYRDDDATETVRDAGAGALLVEAIANSAVPHLVVSLGGGDDPDPCGRAHLPRFHFRWPGADGGPALHASGHLHDDGVIDPRDTRTVLGLCLSALHSGPVEGAVTYRGVA